MDTTVALDRKRLLGIVSKYPALILECRTIGKKPKNNNKKAPNPTTKKYNPKLIWAK